MKKALVAGAASAVLAAMPVLGVFAEGNTLTGNGKYIDSFEFTIANVCYMERGAVAHTSASNGTPATVNDWVTGTGEGDAALTDTLTLTGVTAGNTYSMGSSTFVVKCNFTNGYDVNVTATTLSSGNDQIPVGSTGVSTESSSWTLSQTKSGATSYYGHANTAVASKVQTNAGPNDITTGDSFTIDYNLGLVANQPAGTYTGTATYILTSPAAN